MRSHPVVRRVLGPALIVASGVGWLGVAAAAVEREVNLALAWEKTYGAAGHWYEHRASAATRDGDLVIGFAAQLGPRGSDPASRKLSAWRFDASGAKKAETELVRPPTDPKATPTTPTEPDITAEAALDNGDAMVVAQFEPGRPWIFRVDRSGKQTLARPLVEPPREVAITAATGLPAGTCLLLGSAELDSLMIKLDARGATAWEKRQNRGKTDFAVDGIPGEGDTFVVAENSGSYDMFRRGPSTVWIGKYGANGQRLAQTTLRGRYGRLAPMKDGGYAVVYDKEAGDNQDIWVQAFDRELKPLWASQVIVLKANIAEFKISATSDGGFVVAGARDLRPYVNRLDARGNSRASFWGESLAESVSYDLLTPAGGTFLASSIYEPTPKGADQKLRLIKLSESQKAR